MQGFGSWPIVFIKIGTVGEFSQLDVDAMNRFAALFLILFAVGCDKSNERDSWNAGERAVAEGPIEYGRVTLSATKIVKGDPDAAAVRAGLDVMTEELSRVLEQDEFKVAHGQLEMHYQVASDGDLKLMYFDKGTSIKNVESKDILIALIDVSWGTKKLFPRLGDDAEIVAVFTVVP